MFKHEFSMSIDDMKKKQVFVCRENEIAMGLAKKFSNVKSGQIIRFSDAEYEEFTNHFHIVSIE